MGYVIWGLFTLANLALYAIDLRIDFLDMQAPCTGAGCNFLALTGAEVDALADLALTPRWYAQFMTTISIFIASIYWILAGVILWRQGSTILGLAVSLALAAVPVATFVASNDWSIVYPALSTPAFVFSWLVTMIMLVFFYLLPNGRFSPWWAFWPLALTMGLLTLLMLVIGGMVPLPAEIRPVTDTSLLGLVILGGGLQVHRYRRDSTVLERQQTKWIIFGVIAYVLGVVVWAMVFGGVLEIASGRARLFANMSGWFIDLFFLLTLPAAITIAILRYRLWDIDLVIRRTLQYALLTGLLALLYFGSVVVLQSLLGAFGGGQTQAITVLSTLGIAALFNPLRIRVQGFIDHRFFRAKYDAEQALAGFAAITRDEVDMDRLSTALLSVVDDTIRPSGASLWLSSSERRQ
jgi:hypothetical protein